MLGEQQLAAIDRMKLEDWRVFFDKTRQRMQSCHTSLLLLGAICVVAGGGCGDGGANASKATSRERRGETELKYRDTGASPVGSEQAETNFDGLAKEKQRKIWDLEHATFELEHKFGKDFLANLKDKENGTLVGFFKDGFVGSVLPAGDEDEVDGSWWKEWRPAEVEAQSTSEQPADRDAVIAYLRNYAAGFETIDSAKLRVLAIDTRPGHENQYELSVWLALSGLDDQQRPRALESTHSVTCEFASDEEVEAGNIITQWRILDESTRRSEKYFMEEVTERAGLQGLAIRDNWFREKQEPARLYQFQMAVHDFNRDGYPDIAIRSIEGRQYLLANRDGKSFENVTTDLRLPAVNNPGHLSFSVSWIDFNNDGYPDLLMGPSLYRNDAGESFTDVTATSGIRFVPECEQIGTTIADYDCDGLPDIYMLYSSNLGYRGKTGWVNDAESGAQNQLWRNLGGGKFADVTRATGVDGGRRNSFAAVWLHANDDTRPDLYVANDFGTNSMFISREGAERFDDVSQESGVGDFATSMGVAAGDIDGDAKPDIYVANMYSKMGRRIIGQVDADDYPPGLFAQIQGSCAGSRLYQASSTGEYQERSMPLGINSVGWAYAPALVDLDCDGFLDIYATTGFMSFNRKKPDG